MQISHSMCMYMDYQYVYTGSGYCKDFNTALRKSDGFETDLDYPPCPNVALSLVIHSTLTVTYTIRIKKWHIRNRNMQFISDAKL